MREFETEKPSVDTEGDEIGVKQKASRLFWLIGARVNCGNYEKLWISYDNRDNYDDYDDYDD